MPAALSSITLYPHSTPAAKADADHIHWQFNQLAAAALEQMERDSSAQAARFDASFDTITVEDIDRICGGN